MSLDLLCIKGQTVKLYISDSDSLGNQGRFFILVNIINIDVSTNRIFIDKEIQEGGAFVFYPRSSIYGIEPNYFNNREISYFFATRS